MSADLTTPTAPEPEPRDGLMTLGEYWLCEHMEGVDGRAIVLDLILQAAMETAPAVSVAPQNTAQTAAPTLADVCLTFDRLRAEQRDLKRLLGRQPERPTPYEPPRRPAPPAAQQTAPRDPVAFVGWTVVTVVIIWAVVMTGLTVGY